MLQRFKIIVETSNSAQLSNMQTNRLTATQITALSFAIISAGYIGYLNSKPKLTPHEARTHEVILNTHQAANRALLFPALPPIKQKTKKRKLKAKSKEKQ